jgi:hypothetical protein
MYHLLAFRTRKPLIITIIDCQTLTTYGYVTKPYKWRQASISELFTAMMVVEAVVQSVRRLTTIRPSQFVPSTS